MKADAEFAVKVVVPRLMTAGPIGVGFVWFGGSLDATDGDGAGSVAGGSLAEGSGACVDVGIGATGAVVIVGIFGVGDCCGCALEVGTPTGVLDVAVG
jgi:hypothetical protein